MARRFIAGTGQLLLAVAGFTLIVGWMLDLFHRSMLEQFGDPVPPYTSGWMGKWGAVLFGAAWLWSWFTSISLWRQVRAGEAAARESVPPRLTEESGLPPKLS